LNTEIQQISKRFGGLQNLGAAKKGDDEISPTRSEDDKSNKSSSNAKNKNTKSRSKSSTRKSK